MSSPSTELSIVVPVLDEADNIETFLLTLDPIVAKLDVAAVEYVFVDDGSRDATWAVLDRVSKARDDVVAIRLLHNVGKENALLAGLAAASGQAIVPMDVDLQDPPEVLVRLVAAWHEGNAVVLARRSGRDDSLGRRISARIVYSTVARGARTPIPAEVGDFRLMDRETAARFLQLPERSRYNKGLFALVSPEAPVIEYHRPAGRALVGERPRQSPSRLVSLAADGIVSFTTWPLHLLSVAGFLLLGLSILAFVLGIVLRALNILEVPGQATVVVLVAFVLGFQSLSTGVLGLYISQILTEVKRRPLYFVHETRGLDVDAAQQVTNVARQ